MTDGWSIFWLVVAAACFAWFVGAGMGYYTAAKAEEERKRARMQRASFSQMPINAWACSHRDGRECVNCK